MKKEQIIEILERNFKKNMRDFYPASRGKKGQSFFARNITSDAAKDLLTGYHLCTIDALKALGVENAESLVCQWEEPVYEEYEEKYE